MTARVWFFISVMFVTSSWFLYRISFGATLFAVRTNIINHSPVTAVTSARDRSQVFTFKCAGQIDASAHLEEIGLTQKDLNKGATCVAGDFDGNGYLDFAFWGKPTGKSKTRSFKVLYYEDRKIIRTEIIKNRQISYLWLYPVHNNNGDPGEPATSHEGLVQTGDEGESYIFLYSPLTKHLEYSVHPSNIL